MPAVDLAGNPHAEHSPRPVRTVGSGAAHSWEVPTPIGETHRESGPLPIMPANMPSVENQSAASAGAEPSASAVSVSLQQPVTPGPTAVPHRTAQQNDRLYQIATHGYAMADDEALFQLEHLASCQASNNPRQFIVLPPLHVIKWLSGNDEDFHTWLSDNRQFFGAEGYHVFTMLLIEQHWIPVWFAPCHGGVIAHSLSEFASDDRAVDQVLYHLVHKCGSALQTIHRVPHGLPIQRLCGVMSICFLAHVILRTRMPVSIEDVYVRCWSMKQIFAEAIQQGLVTEALHWGWGADWESRPLPIMPVWGPFVTEFQLALDVTPDRWFPHDIHDVALASEPDLGMTFSEMSHHLASLSAACPFPVTCVPISSVPALVSAVADVLRNPTGTFAGALLHDFHWSPVLVWHTRDRRNIIVVECEDAARCLIDQFSEVEVYCLPPTDVPYCGASTWLVLAQLWSFSGIAGDIGSVRAWLKQFCPADDPSDHRTGFGPHSQLLKNLSAELFKHGVPPGAVDDRARAAIKTLGSEQLLEALNHRQSWRQLKILGNNSKFQFVLPSELASAVEANKGKPVSVKGKGKGKSKTVPQAIDLDPSKLQVLEGTFKFHDRVLPQLSMKQIGPLSSGVILMSHQDAEPYLKAGKLVSQEPLALVVLSSAGHDVRTALPHGPFTVPCRCTVNNEPVLVDAVIVQVGHGTVEKAAGSHILAVDTPEVVTLKVLVYKDELKMDWGEFCTSPIKCLVSLLPMLKRCNAEDCQCPGWHNAEQLPIRDPILDVWRRQYLRQGFKPCPPDQAEYFSVCLRIPHCLLDVLLSASGAAGAYCEPRTADGKEVLPDYTVVWAPRHSHQEIQHLMQTNPAVTGLVRLGHRRGLRVRSDQAKGIHQLVRPDAIYLPSGPKCQYSAGPFPYGADRLAVGKVLAQAGWECRPLQPSTPCPGRGVMWLIQSTVDPDQSIISTTNGEIMISKIKQDTASVSVSPTTVGSVATLALCEKQTGQRAEVDPWTVQDPWKQYQPGHVAVSGPQVGLQQIEERIRTDVLAKIQPPMEQDDLPDRVHALEGQVQQLLGKQQGLEAQFHEHSAQHSQQITALQGQVANQSQQLHGHLENQNQTIQSLFEQQMQQIRGLLAKRPRDEGLE